MSEFPRSRRPTVVCVRYQDRARRVGLTVAALSAGLGLLASMLPHSSFSPVTTAKPSESEDLILGDGSSLADVVSGVFERNRTPKMGAGKLGQVQRSGLTNASPAPTPKPGGLMEALFGPVPSSPPPTTLNPAAPAPVKSYRTVCVRLCDGAFFPVSPATTREYFRRDEKTCAESCNSPSRLFAYEVDGGSPETMEDLEGTPYMELAGAFKYLDRYDPSCTCRAHPWEQASLDRHRRYAEAETREPPGQTTVTDASGHPQQPKTTVEPPLGSPVFPPSRRELSPEKSTGASRIRSATLEPQSPPPAAARKPKPGKAGINEPKSGKSQARTPMKRLTADDIFRSNLSR